MDTKFFLKLLDSGFILKTALILLLVSLLLIGEIYLIEYISEFWGTYFTLALVAATGLVGLVFSFREILALIRAIKSEAAVGSYPKRDLVLLAGAVIGGILLLVPGFVTDFLGVISFFPVIRSLYGRILTHNFGSRLNEFYEYLKLYE